MNYAVVIIHLTVVSQGSQSCALVLFEFLRERENDLKCYQKVLASLSSLLDSVIWSSFSIDCTSDVRK
jgi:hypothetical protein